MIKKNIYIYIILYLFWAMKMKMKISNVYFIKLKKLFKIFNINLLIIL